jgi:hypothetical protein
LKIIVISISYQDIKIKYYAKSIGRINYKTNIKLIGSPIIIIGSMNKLKRKVINLFISKAQADVNSRCLIKYIIEITLTHHFQGTHDLNARLTIPLIDHCVQESYNNIANSSLVN